MRKIFYSFDGCDSEREDSHTFVRLAAQNDSGKLCGCDCYFDGLGGIAKVVDWAHGNGLIANDVISLLQAVAISSSIYMGYVVDNVEPA